MLRNVCSVYARPYYGPQGFRLRLEAGRFIRSFSIPCPVLWFQYLWKFLFYYYNWIYWLEDNRILQLNSSKLPHYFFSLLIEWNIWLASVSFPRNWSDHFVFIPVRPRPVKAKSPGKTHYTCWSNKKRAKEFCRLLQSITHLCLILKIFVWANGI